MQRHTSLRKRLGDAVEVVLVLLLDFGLFTYSSTYKALIRRFQPNRPIIFRRFL